MLVWSRTNYWAAACLCVCFSTASAAELTTVSGKKLSGEIASIGAQGIALKTASGEITTPLDDTLLVEIGPITPIQAKYTEVELVDGSILRCSSVAFKQNQAELTLHGGPVVNVPLAAVSSLLNDANDPKV